MCLCKQPGAITPSILPQPFGRHCLNTAAAGRVRSIDRVKREILRGNDDLAAWAKDEFGPYFVCTDQDGVIGAYRKIMAWVQQQRQFSDAVKAHFAGGADGWLVACAKVHNYVIVDSRAVPP